MERRAAAPVLSLEQTDLPPFFSLSVTKRWQQTTLTNRAFGTKHLALKIIRPILGGFALKIIRPHSGALP
jgi:hypothetical protein